MHTRSLARIPIAPGARGVNDLIAALPSAFDGAPIAPVPATSTTVSDTYVSHLLQAVRPDAPLERDDVAVVLPTSGSTGAPRGVMLSAAAITASAHGSATLLRIPTEESAWLVAIPVTSAGGFSVTVRSWLGGHIPEVLESIGGALPFRPADFVARTQSLKSRSADRRMLTALVPTQLSRLLDDPDGQNALREFAAILIGGARFDATLRARAEAADVHVVSTYGLTETAGGCVYDGTPFPNVDLVTQDDGEVLVRGPVLALGYRLDPQLTEERFVEGWLHTGDIGVLGDDRLTIVGRRDDIVTIKGVNVATTAVERVICSVPGVDSCAVIATAEPIDGHRLTAFVVAGEDCVQQIRMAVAEQLGPVAVPSTFATVTSLPVLPNGKTDRAALAVRPHE